MPKPDAPPGKPDKVKPVKPTKPAKEWQLLDAEGDAVLDANGEPVVVVILEKLPRGYVRVADVVSGTTYDVRRGQLYREEEAEETEAAPVAPAAP